MCVTTTTTHSITHTVSSGIPNLKYVHQIKKEKIVGGKERKTKMIYSSVLNVFSLYCTFSYKTVVQIFLAP